jgi:hypothetical protein
LQLPAVSFDGLQLLLEYLHFRFVLCLQRSLQPSPDLLAFLGELGLGGADFAVLAG